MKRAALYICYYTLNDPLTESQVVAYLRELAARDIEMHLLTFERELPVERKQALKELLAQAGITWHTLRYHKRPSLPATLYDITLGALKAWRICRAHDIGFIHARSHVPAAMALLLQRACGYRWLFDLRGLLAEEYVDGGNWRAGEFKFRLVKRMERAFFRRADALVMLTERIKDELVKTEPALRERAADITVIPCCVDADRFGAAQPKREAYRRERGWSERRVLVYVGKLGTWYPAAELVRFFAALRRVDQSFFFQVLTQDDPEPIRQACAALGVAEQDYDIRFAPPEQLPLILSAADASLSFRKGEYSKLAASPTKVGESLAAGLPLVTNAGIGDCDQILTTHGLGVSLREFSAAEYNRAAEALCELLADSQIAERCRGFAGRELSYARVGGPRYAAIYERLLAPDVHEMATESSAA